MTRGFRAGFTLMELVVAIVITGVVAAIGYATFTSIIDHRAVIQRATIETEHAAALRETLYEWLTKASGYNIARVPKSVASLRELWLTKGSRVGARGNELGGFEVMLGDRGELSLSLSAGATALPRMPGAKYGLAFFSTSSIALARAPFTQVWLFVDDDPTTPERGLTMRYSATNASGWNHLALLEASRYSIKGLGYDNAVATRELEPRVVALRIEVLDLTNRWQRIDESGVVPTTSPVAIRLTLEGAPNDPLPPLLRLPFVVSTVDHVNVEPSQ